MYLKRPTGNWGSHCTVDMLDWVVTVGEKANTYLAPAARQKGCQVKECIDAIEAGAFVRNSQRMGLRCSRVQAEAYGLRRRSR